MKKDRSVYSHCDKNHQEVLASEDGILIVGSHSVLEGLWGSRFLDHSFCGHDCEGVKTDDSMGNGQRKPCLYRYGPVESQFPRIAWEETRLLAFLC